MEDLIDTPMEGTVQARLYEGMAMLLPGCLPYHGKGKERLQYGQDPNEPTELDCDYYKICDDAHLLPESAKVGYYRLRTTDPVHDLKRWVTRPNGCISGQEQENRNDVTEMWMATPPFHDEHFRKCILWAVKEIEHIHSTIQVQVEYLAAAPYHKHLEVSPIVNAIPTSELPTPEDIRNLSRCELAGVMGEVAAEIKYLETSARDIRERTVELKWQGAKDGHWGEIADLIESGWMNEEQVQNECRV